MASGTYTCPISISLPALYTWRIITRCVSRESERLALRFLKQNTQFSLSDRAFAGFRTEVQNDLPYRNHGGRKKKRKKKVKGGKKCCEGFSISITAAYISTVYQEKGIATTICSLPSLKKKKKRERRGHSVRNSRFNDLRYTLSPGGNFSASSYRLYRIKRGAALR